MSERCEPLAPPPQPECPVCGRPREAKFSPFCSRRCADVDLGRWLSGAYAIAGEDADPDASDEP